MSEELVPTVNLSPAVTLDAYGVHQTVGALLELNDLAARILAARIHKEWRWKVNPYITLRLTANELDLIRQAGGSSTPQLVRYRYLAVYRNEATGTEVRLRSIDRPPKKRTFRTTDRGRRRFKRIRLFRIHPSKEKLVPKAKTKGKKKNPKASSDDTDDDELESLEELEELEADEPEDDDEEDEEDEAPPKRRKRKSSAKKSKSKKSKKVVDEDDEDEDDDDEDEEEETPKKKSKPKSKKGKKGKKGKGKSGDGAGHSTAELTGGVGSSELAAAASEIAEEEITGRDVRVYLRRNEIPKDEEHSRYVWPSVNNKEFKKLAKAIAAEFEDED